LVWLEEPKCPDLVTAGTKLVEKYCEREPETVERRKR
jgi:hypothetical protein